MAGAIRVIDGIKYKEVNRKARPGDKIVTVTYYGGEMEPGDIGTVDYMHSSGDGSLRTNCGAFFDIAIGDSYIVLEPVDAMNESLLGVIADLTACVAKLTEEVRELRKNQ